MRKIFLTFGDGGLNFIEARDRLMREAASTGMFDEIRGYDWSDIKDSIVLSSPLRQYKRGCGYWLWKPAIINAVLEELNDGDILVYCDSGDSLSRSSRQWRKFFAELDEEMQRTKQSIDSQQDEIDKAKESISGTIESLKQTLADLKVQEDEIIPDLDSEVVFKFERIIKNKQNQGIVAVKGNVCDGCHMILPAQFANEVRKGDNIVFCPYCSRILFYQHQEEGEDEYYNMDDTGSLVDLDDDFDEEDEDYESEERDEIKEMDFGE